MHSKEYARQKIIDIGQEIHHIKNFNSVEIESKILSVEKVIKNSNLSYTDVFILMRGIATEQEFNRIMPRLKKLII